MIYPFIHILADISGLLLDSVLIIPFSIKYAIAFTNSVSEIKLVAHHPAVFFTQSGTFSANAFGITNPTKEITIADIPGLIEGAHEGIGLGIKFLKHIERCKTLLHMIDINENDLEKSYNQIKNELASYSKELLKKKEIIVLNKIDLLNEKDVKDICKKFSKNKKSEVITLSTFKKDSISKIKAKLLNYVS